MQIIRMFVTIGTLILQVFAIKEQIKLRMLLKRSKSKQTKKHNDKKTTHIDVPEWVERLIDDYIISSEKDMRQ